MASSRNVAFFGDAHGIVLAHCGNGRHGIVGPLRANRNGSMIGRVRSGRSCRARAQCPREADMTHMSRAVLALVAIALLAAASGASAQTLPNPYRLVENWAQIPAAMNGGKWGEV